MFLKILTIKYIAETNILALKPSYVARNAGAPLGRASWLNYFGSNSIFDAGDRDVNYHSALRGVAKPPPLK